MSLLDTFTGGKSDEATDAYKRAEQYYADINTPTIEQLTLPQLQQYVEAGLMTPAEAQSYLQGSNAYNNENIDQAGTAAQKTSLGQLQQIAGSGDMGTPQEQAMVEKSLQQARTADAGARGSIEQGMAARGTPYALIQGALEGQATGQDAQQAHNDAVNAAGNAYANKMVAMTSAAGVGSNLQGQMNNQANTVAGAQNAMQQFNAANQQQAGQFNAANKQEANAMNAQNRQQISNNNVGNVNARTQYNANLPETVFNNQMQKAGGMAGAATNYGNIEQQQGKQNAGIWSGLINTATSFIPKPAGSKNGAMPTGEVEGPQYPGQGHGYAHGGIVEPICMDDGGLVPGDSPFPGDNPMNDNMPIQASPGEMVLPRSSVAKNPDMAMALLNDQDQGPPIDSQDVAVLLKAMRSIRLGAV